MVMVYVVNFYFISSAISETWRCVILKLVNNCFLRISHFSIYFSQNNLILPYIPCFFCFSETQNISVCLRVWFLVFSSFLSLHIDHFFHFSSFSISFSLEKKATWFVRAIQNFDVCFFRSASTFQFWIYFRTLQRVHRTLRLWSGHSSRISISSSITFQND